MLFAASRCIIPLANLRDIQVQTVRLGHQMCTRNPCKAPKPKHRGIKRGEGVKVQTGYVLVTQRVIRFHPGMNVEMDWNKSLVATAPGIVKITAERFHPNFKNEHVQEQYGERRGQRIFKKYMNVIPFEQRNEFRLVDVV